MKNKLIGFLTALLVFGVLTYHTEIVKAIGVMLRSGLNVPTGALTMQTSNSTTSPNFLQNGLGTTTLTFESEKFSALTLYLQVLASSTNATSPLNIQLQASDDNIQFFDYDPTILNSNSFAQGLAMANVKGTTTIPVASTTIPYVYQPATRGATTTKALNVNILPARYTRVIFSISTTTPNSAATPYFDGINLWANAVGQIGNAPQ